MSRIDEIREVIRERAFKDVFSDMAKVTIDIPRFMYEVMCVGSPGHENHDDYLAFNLAFEQAALEGKVVPDGYAHYLDPFVKEETVVANEKTAEPVVKSADQIMVLPLNPALI